MSIDVLPTLLSQLAAGNPDAAERVFRAYQPYLRMVVRRQLPRRLRAQFDSADVVQSVWADVWRRLGDGQQVFDSPGQLRAFLVKATRNRFIDYLRRHRREAAPRTGRDRPLPTARGDGETAAGLLAAEELWERMVRESSPAHREILLLKREGHSLAEIARRVGFHESSVRRVLYDLHRRYAAGPPGGRKE
jgi:RNA polymerase sigma-70 factor (ECF subfamily)